MIELHICTSQIVIRDYVAELVHEVIQFTFKPVGAKFLVVVLASQFLQQLLYYEI